MDILILLIIVAVCWPAKWDPAILLKEYLEKKRDKGTRLD